MRGQVDGEDRLRYSWSTTEYSNRYQLPTIQIAISSHIMHKLFALLICWSWAMSVNINISAAAEKDAVPLSDRAPILIKNIPPELKEIDVDYAYRDRLVVVLMGDPQLPMTDESEAHVKKAMGDIKHIKHDFMAVLGDLIQPVGGHEDKVKRYNLYSNLVLKPATKSVFSISGNADCGMGLDYYQKVTGLPNHYVVKRRGIRFIFLGTTKMSGAGRHICHVGEEGMHFLEEELDKDKKSTTVLFHHSPVQNTTYMSGKGARNTLRAVHKPRDMFMGESERMRKLMKDNDNIKMFACGHVHYRYGEKDTDGRGAYHAEDGVLHVTVGASANDRGSSMVEFRDDSITVRVRDHDKKVWKEKHQQVVPIKTTLKLK